jgi:hypothetical protein
VSKLLTVQVLLLSTWWEQGWTQYNNMRSEADSGWAFGVLCTTVLATGFMPTHTPLQLAHSQQHLLTSTGSAVGAVLMCSTGRRTKPPRKVMLLCQHGWHMGWWVPPVCCMQAALGLAVAPSGGVDGGWGQVHASCVEEGCGCRSGQLSACAAAVW